MTRGFRFNIRGKEKSGEPASMIRVRQQIEAGQRRRRGITVGNWKENEIPETLCKR